MYRVKRLNLLLVFLLLIAVCSITNTSSVNAELLQSRTLSINDSNGGAVTRHEVSFRFDSSEPVGSIVLEYCTSPVEDVACVSPTGLDAAAAVFANQSGATGFAVYSQTTNRIILSRIPASPGNQLNTYTFNNVRNPNNVGTFFLRISTYGSTDGAGTKIDYGATAAAITTAISIEVEVPPTLYFCAAILIDSSCETAEGNYLNLGTLTHERAAIGTSRFAASTNANFGYVVLVYGSTMTSGNNVINAMSSPSASVPGTRQFGINLRANTAPSVGQEYTGIYGVISPDYNIPNSFKFADGDLLASSPHISLFEVYTVSYVVNVQEFQPAGIYNTLLNYVCLATF